MTSPKRLAFEKAWEAFVLEVFRAASVRVLLKAVPVVLFIISIFFAAADGPGWMIGAITTVRCNTGVYELVSSPTGMSEFAVFDACIMFLKL